jgi:hypothetical protein
MLPDLWRMADRRVRPSRAAERPTDAGRALADVLDGIDHHVAVDRWFHAAPVFCGGERRLAQQLRHAAPTAPRIALFAHVLWEMCLDGALIRRVGLPPLLDELRAGLAAVDGAPSDAAASIHHFARASVLLSGGDAGRAAFDARLRRLCQEVARGPWIAGYQDGVGLAMRLAGVRAGFGFPAFTPEQLSALAALLDGSVADADRAVEEIVMADWALECPRGRKAHPPDAAASAGRTDGSAGLGWGAASPPGLGGLP